MGEAASVNNKLAKFLSENKPFGEVARQLFREADDDNNGILTPKEINSVTDRLFDSIEKDLAAYGMQFNRPTAEQVQELIRVVDTENNCVLDESEFVQFYRQVRPHVLYLMPSIGMVKVVKQYADAGREETPARKKRRFGGALWKIVVATAGVFGVKIVAPHVPAVGPMLSPLIEVAPVLVVGPLLGALWILMASGRNNQSLKNELHKDTKKNDAGPSKE